MTPSVLELTPRLFLIACESGQSPHRLVVQSSQAIDVGLGLIEQAHPNCFQIQLICSLAERDGGSAASGGKQVRSVLAKFSSMAKRTQCVRCKRWMSVPMAPTLLPGASPCSPALESFRIASNLWLFWRGRTVRSAYTRTFELLPPSADTPRMSAASLAARLGLSLLPP